MRILKLRQVKVVILIYYQILVTNLQGNELKGRIYNQILGVKGWKIFKKLKERGKREKKDNNFLPLQ